MKYLQLIAFGILAAASFSGAWAQTTEVHLAVAPRISLPSDCPTYSEELSNYWGTAISTLESPALRARAEAQLGHKAPDTLSVVAVQIPHTSIFSIDVEGTDDATAKPFLTALIDQFLKARLEKKKKFYADAIANAEKAITTAPKELVPELTTYKNHLVMASLLDTRSDLEISEF